jgi:redox-sensitive bicupin YhaK (pirin superfamily)
MITLRPAGQRFHSDMDWLDSWHTFSFAHHHDPRWMGFRALRVINDDRIAPAHGFDTHGHRDMEILTWVLEGTLEHRDSMGTGSIIRPGEVQRMTAGTGVLHSERNPSLEEPLHLLQIWIQPDGRGMKPGYAQKDVTAGLDRLRLVASSDGRDGSISVHQDVAVWAARSGAGDRLRHDVAEGRYLWVHLARGRGRLNGMDVVAGDGAGFVAEPTMDLESLEDSEVLVFDLA